MRKLLLATAALLVMTTASQAALITNLGVNPRSAQGHFSNEVGGDVFTDQYTFQLVGDGFTFLTFASATNDYADPEDFITGFTGQLFEQVGAIGPDGGADIAAGPLVQAVACPGTTTGCQILAGSATLDAGNYYLQLSGDGGGTAGYGGNLTVSAQEAAVPELGTWMMMLLGFAGVGTIAMRKRQKQLVRLV